jgi:predicted glycosyltransferase involved in capsule biosynthesis
MIYTDQTLQKSKYNLTETSFIIHFRRDSDDRIFNLKCILNYFNTYIDYKELFIINDDSELDHELENLQKKYPKISIGFFKNDDIYQRTLCFNKIATIATGKVLCFYDTDVLVKPECLQHAQKLILNGSLDHVYPYNGLFVDVKKEHRELLVDFNFSKLESLLLERHIGYDNEYMTVAHDHSVGGINMLSKIAFNRIEGYNTNFIGWGCEDVDIYTKSGFKNKVAGISSPDAICWHIHHDNTIRTEHKYYQNNLNLLYNNNK